MLRTGPGIHRSRSHEDLRKSQTALPTPGVRLATAFSKGKDNSYVLATLQESITKTHDEEISSVAHQQLEI